MKVPCCSVCHNRYDEGERVPLLLSCGHGFCLACLSRLFSASLDTSLSCPRCRHSTLVGNSVHALRKNFPVLSLLSSSPSSPSFDVDFTDDDEDRSSNYNDLDDDYFGSSSRSRKSGLSKTSFLGDGDCSSSPIDLGTHHDLRLTRKLGSNGAGQETWVGTLGSSGGGKCRHRVAVKRVAITDGMDVMGVQGKLESLRRESMWCRNVCTFHGAVRMDGHLCLVMDRCTSSIQAEMRQNKGRLTLEQILRYGADIARGVAELHVAGVVCMNLKPSNLLLDENCRAVVSDCGLLEILRRPMC